MDNIFFTSNGRNTYTFFTSDRYNNYKNIMRTSIKFLTIFTLGAMFGFYFGWVNVTNAQNYETHEDYAFYDFEDHSVGGWLSTGQPNEWWGTSSSFNVVFGEESYSGDYAIKRSGTAMQYHLITLATSTADYEYTSFIAFQYRSDGADGSDTLKLVYFPQLRNEDGHGGILCPRVQLRRDPDVGFDKTNSFGDVVFDLPHNEWNYIYYAYTIFWDSENNHFQCDAQLSVNASEFSGVETNTRSASAGNNWVSLYWNPSAVGLYYFDDIRLGMAPQPPPPEGPEYPTMPEHSFASSITDITMSGTSTIFKNVQYVLFENEVDTNWSHRNPDRLHMKADCLNCAFDVQVDSFFSIDSADTGVQYATTTRKYHHDGDYKGLITFYSSTSSGSIFPGTGLKVFFTVQDGEVLPGFEIQREASALSSWEERLIDASEAGCTLSRLDRCLILAVQALFFPREGYFQGWDIVIANLQTAFPFKYLYEIYSLFTSATVGESQTYTIGVPFNTGEGGTTTLTILNTEEHIVNNQFLPDGFFNIIRTLFGFMIYLGLLLYIFKRVKGFITKLA